MRDPSLPDYASPPAQETWMSFRFAPLPWSIPHFGAFWHDIRDEYPNFEVHPPVGEFKLEFNALSPEAVVNLPVRCWFITEDRDRLLQVQPNRFYHNWRRSEAGTPYLHYDALKPLFVREWRRFCEFAERYGIGHPNVLGAEVAYINHLDRGTGWNDFSELSAIFPNAGSFKGRSFLANPEAIAVRSSYAMNSRDGKLHVEIQPAVRQSDGREIIQLTITGTCRPGTMTDEELFSCLDECRSWIVKGFDDITSDVMHEIWGKK
jgi:uncharacterized protein (TIGR04255 family)